ncbi:hypothetical protein B0T22DRAFT_479045 [Podospora appendiculata]|uniref:Uncharacterized protein n=1 Tax=Podospora appendiculata TaxID=314037 RepID=A0AAE0X8D9_9PEZI|nr:hypothetical protein B0T22DRAFT_479045 [Podospora appendiculata]
MASPHRDVDMVDHNNQDTKSSLPTVFPGSSSSGFHRQGGPQGTLWLEGLKCQMCAGAHSSESSRDFSTGGLAQVGHGMTDPAISSEAKLEAIARNPTAHMPSNAVMDLIHETASHPTASATELALANFGNHSVEPQSAQFLTAAALVRLDAQLSDTKKMLQEVKEDRISTEMYCKTAKDAIEENVLYLKNLLNHFQSQSTPAQTAKFEEYTANSEKEKAVRGKL